MPDNIILQLADVISDEANMPRDIARTLLTGGDTGDGSMADAAFDDLVSLIDDLFLSTFYCSDDQVGLSPAMSALFHAHLDPELWVAAARELDPTESNLAAALRDTARDNILGG